MFDPLFYLMVSCTKYGKIVLYISGSSDLSGFIRCYQRVLIKSYSEVYCRMYSKTTSNIQGFASVKVFWFCHGTKIWENACTCRLHTQQQFCTQLWMSKQNRPSSALKMSKFLFDDDNRFISYWDILDGGGGGGAEKRDNAHRKTLIRQPLPVLCCTL